MATGKEIVTMAITTNNTPDSFSPDQVVITPDEAVPEALILRAATVVTRTLDGDAPVALIPWVDDADARFVAEGDFMETDTPTASEVTVGTAKISQLLRVSREQWHTNPAGRLLSNSTTRAITRKANEAFIAQPTGGAVSLTGIVHTPGIITGDPITTNLDPLADAVAQIENNNGQPGIIIANPLAWGALRNLKTADTANTSLLGAGTNDTDKRLLGIEVVTSAAVPEGQLVIVDPNAIAAAVGPFEVFQSEHQYFEYDSIAIRATWRIGWAVQHANRLAVVNVGE